jgi:hypothetical protein
MPGRAKWICSIPSRCSTNATVKNTSTRLPAKWSSKAKLARSCAPHSSSRSTGKRACLVERGVRFVQLFIERQIWDNHTKIATTLRNASEKTDKPIAGLLQDLRQRGLMDDTLVLWCGEFGRLPIAQLRGTTEDKDSGRDHNKNAFTVWMAGAGVKRGLTYGATDELGFAAVENRVSVCDWHATILHLLGVDVEKLTYDVHGLKERLTGVFDYKVLQDILA